MKSFRKLVAQGRLLEQEGDVPGAIERYRIALALQEEAALDTDLELTNHIGDLHLGLGDVKRAITVFEGVIDAYEEQQLYSNAIALCKKILRNAPDRMATHRQLGRLLAKSGLRAEARSHYLEYTQQLEQAGRMAQALEALNELAKLLDDDEIRFLLAERYGLAGRPGDAVEVLTDVWRRRVEQGADASEVRERILAIDAGADPLGVELAREAGLEAADSVAEKRRAHEVDELMTELRDVLQRLEGEEKLRQALPIVDQLLQLQPGKLDLLLRKLRYSLALGEEQGAVDAYLSLGSTLEQQLKSFRIRVLSSSSEEGVSAAVNVDRTSGTKEAES